ncbi:hypothetical protein CDO33_08870 [Clostridium thermosuccinogenes]|jgi:hypothetical protein|nr:hypothetical protein CDO33_08870 [Pseudoclostridium thermosuccinogenes]
MSKHRFVESGKSKHDGHRKFSSYGHLSLQQYLYKSISLFLQYSIITLDANKPVHKKPGSSVTV